MTPLDANGHLPSTHRPAPDLIARRPRLTIQRLLALIAFVAVLFGIVRPLYLIGDATVGGPSTRKFQERLLRTATEAHLIGRPEGDVVKIPGPPTSFIAIPAFHEVHPSRVYRYAPSWSRAGTFQVLCVGGVVKDVRGVLDEYD